MRGVAPGLLQKTVRVAVIAKGAGGEPWQAPHVPGIEGQREAVRGDVARILDTVGREVVVLPLLAVADDGRAGVFEFPDGVADGPFVETLCQGTVGTAGGKCVNEFKWPRNAANGLGRYHERG